MAEHIGTTCVQGGYRPGDAEPRQVPIYQSTTWKYDTSNIWVACSTLRSPATSTPACRTPPTTTLPQRSPSSKAAPPPC